jgi:hypothetical protein
MSKTRFSQRSASFENVVALRQLGFDLLYVTGAHARAGCVRAGRRGVGERAPSDAILLGGLETTWSVLLSLKPSCVDLQIALCQRPRVFHDQGLLTRPSPQLGQAPADGSNKGKAHF